MKALSIVCLCLGLCFLLARPHTVYGVSAIHGYRIGHVAVYRFGATWTAFGPAVPGAYMACAGSRCVVFGQRGVMRIRYTS